MATSLALLAGAGWASAQAPQWENNGPAKTQWAPFPIKAVPKAMPAIPPLAIPPVTEPVNPIGTRVVLFQKPAELPQDKTPSEMKAEPKPATSSEPLTSKVFSMDGDETSHRGLLAPDDKESVENRKKNMTTVNPALTRMATTPPMRALLEPGYVVHRKLYFEDKNAERYGWNLGAAQPFVSAGYFFKDVLLWPSNLGSNLREKYSTNAGKYLPGSPVPYYLYPPEITLVGGSLGAAAIIGTIFLLP